MKINTNGNWKLYWGARPLPERSKAVGTVVRDNGESGALIEMATGLYVQGNAGALRSLPQRAIHEHFLAVERGRQGGKATGPTKARNTASAAATARWAGRE